MCNVLTQIIMPSFLGHFPMFYAFFSTKKPVFLPKHQKQS
jgi:hypothetical protein